MAAGLGFKTFTTGEVLTAADTNGYLMQGVLVFADSTARDAAITSPQEGQFAYLKDTNVTTYYTGSAWANLDTTGMTNPMTTTGDVIYSSSGSTPARLGIGTAGQVLAVNSGATAPEWVATTSGGMTLLSTTSMSGTSVTVSGIAGGYQDLRIVTSGLLFDTGNGVLQIQLNGETGVVYASAASTNTQLNVSTTILRTGGNNTSAITIFDYTSLKNKGIMISSANRNGADTEIVGFGNAQGAFETTSAITSITFFINSAQNITAGTIKIYGVK